MPMNASQPAAQQRAAAQDYVFKVMLAPSAASTRHTELVLLPAHRCKAAWLYDTSLVCKMMRASSNIAFVGL
jgi:hypothetical protein